jgi:hypothetical protein
LSLEDAGQKRCHFEELLGIKLTDRFFILKKWRTGYFVFPVYPESVDRKGTTYNETISISYLACTALPLQKPVGHRNVQYSVQPNNEPAPLPQ